MPHWGLRPVQQRVSVSLIAQEFAQPDPSPLARCYFPVTTCYRLSCDDGGVDEIPSKSNKHQPPSLPFRLRPSRRFWRQRFPLSCACAQVGSHLRLPILEEVQPGQVHLLRPELERVPPLTSELLRSLLLCATLAIAGESASSAPLSRCAARAFRQSRQTPYHRGIHVMASVGSEGQCVA